MLDISYKERRFYMGISCQLIPMKCALPSAVAFVLEVGRLKKKKIFLQSV